MRIRLAAVLIAIGAVSLARAQEFVLVEDGAARATVALGEEPTDVELLARDELIRYVAMASGAALPVEGELPGRVEWS